MLFRLPFFVRNASVCSARDSPSRLNTMCLPARCTRTIRLPSSVAAMMAAGDLSGWFLEPIQTDSTLSPAMRVSRPRAMVSTSGSSGTLSGYKIDAARFCRGPLRRQVQAQPQGVTGEHRGSTGDTKGYSAEFRFAPPQPDSVCWSVHTKFRRSSQVPSLFSSSGAASVCDSGAGLDLRPRKIPSGVCIDER